MVCQVISAGAVTDPASQAQFEAIISGSIKAPTGAFSRSRNFRAIHINLKPLPHHGKLGRALSMWLGSTQEISGVKAAYFDVQLLRTDGKYRQPNVQHHR